MKLKIFLLSILFGAAFTVDVTYPYVCKEEDRDKMCTMEYIGVCGWFSSKIQCIKAPCAITTGTVCQACTNPGVEKVTLGECEGRSETFYQAQTDFTSPYFCQDSDRKLTCEGISDPQSVCAYRKCDEGECTEKVPVCSACSDSSVNYIKSTCSGTFTQLSLVALLVIFFL